MERPKRLKSKDNPYTIGYDEINNVYTIEFKDNKNETHNIEISKEVYDAFDKFELEDISQMHKYSRHIEHSEIFDNNLHKRSFHKPVYIDDEIEHNILIEKLKSSINELPETQKRRLKLYFFGNMTFEEIGKLENCTKRAIKFSVDIAIEKISKKIKF